MKVTRREAILGVLAGVVGAVAGAWKRSPVDPDVGGEMLFIDGASAKEVERWGFTAETLIARLCESEFAKSQHHGSVVLFVRRFHDEYTYVPFVLVGHTWYLHDGRFLPPYANVPPLRVAPSPERQMQKEREFIARYSMGPRKFKEVYLGRQA